MRVPYWLWPWCVFLFCLPLSQLIPAAIYIVELGAAGMLACAPGRGAFRPGWRVGAVSLFVLILCVTSVFALEPGRTVQPLTVILLAYASYVLGTSVRLRRSELETAMRAWLWGGAMASAVVLFAFLGGSATRNGRAIAVWGSYHTDPNVFMVGQVFPFAIGLYFAFVVKRHREALPALFVIGAAAVLMQSRGGLLSLLVVALLTLACAGRRKTAAALTAGVLGLYFALMPFLGRWDLSKDPTGAKRTIIWQALLPAGLERWPLGIGLFNSEVVTALASGFYTAYAPHSTYVQAFVEAGLFGLLGLLLVFATHMFFPGKAPFHTSLRVGMAGLAVSALFIHLLIQHFLWIPLILIGQAANLAAEDPEEDVAEHLTLQRR